MALTARPKVQQLAQFLSSSLRDNAIVRNAWVDVSEGTYFVSIVVETDDMAAEQEMRKVYRHLLERFPELLIDVYVTNINRHVDREAFQSCPSGAVPVRL